jgi:hypothetical protein
MSSHFHNREVSLFQDGERGRKEVSDLPKVPTARREELGPQSLFFKLRTLLTSNYGINSITQPGETRNREQQHYLPVVPVEQGSEVCVPKADKGRRQEGEGRKIKPQARGRWQVKLDVGHGREKPKSD